MLTAEARVETDRASRYLDQLCRHTQQMGQRPHYRPRTHGGGDTHRPPEVCDVEWSETQGAVRLSLGQWALRATPEALVLRVEASNEDDLQRMQGLIAARLEKIGRRDHLSVSWRRSEVSGFHPGEADETDGSHPQQAPRRARRWSLKAVGGIVALFVVGHLALGGSVLAVARWWGWGAGAIILLVVVVKLIGLGGLAARHGHRRRRRERV
ncbi:DUF2218 domain-containing protein [Streptomyces sp. NBC_00019]|uniref:DUF2218 domain-containing protein n=1 Tax=Streptomyces sp. NBC_00019 TaxID=2975623 RepID=UPI00324F6012